MVVRLTKHHQNVTHVKDMIFSKREELLCLLMNFSTNFFKVSVKILRMHFFSNRYFVVTTMNGSSLLQYPLVLVSEFELELSFRKIQSSEVGAAF